MARVFSLCVTILLLVFGSISLSGADPGSVDKRDIVVDNAIGGMREGSRIVAPDQYGKKTVIPKVPGNQISPIADTRVVAGALAGGTSVAGSAGAGNFPGGSSSGTPTGINEGGGTATLVEPGTGVEPDLGGSTATDSGGGSLININVDADLSSGSVDAGVSLDTDNTDKILDADLTAGAGETGSLTSSTDIAAGDLTVDSGLPPEITESAISSETDIGTEVDTSGGTIGSEADIGVEADVEGGTESDAANKRFDVGGCYCVFGCGVCGEFIDFGI